ADEGYRSRLSRRLGKVPELEVVGQADPGISAFAAAAALEVDVLVLHVELPLDGQLDGIRTLDPSRPRPLILVLGRLGRADTERVEASGADAVVSPAVGSRSLARLITILASQRSSVDPTAPVGGTLWSSGEGLPRRSFLRGAVFGAAGAAALTALQAGPALGSDTSVPPRTDLELPPDNDSILVRMQQDLQRALAKPIEQRKWAMVIDLRKCIGCSACTVSCVAENHLPPGVVYRPVSEQEVGTYPNVARQFLPRPCMHCDDPPCTDVCPVAATYKRPDGIVEINYDKCIGCRYCIPACPYGARTFDWG